MKLSFLPPKNGTRKWSIAKALTLMLAVTVLVVSISTIAVTYFLSTKKDQARLEEKADELLRALVGVLEIPLWNLDRRNINKIGEAYAQNELLETLIIADNFGNTYFELRRNSDSAPVSRAEEVSHDAQVIGHVEIALTTVLNLEQNRQLLWLGIGLMVVVILVLVLATRFFFQILLNKLLYRLDMIADAYASGTFDPSRHYMPFSEFQPLIGILSDMRDKLNHQLCELRNAEKKYRSIVENAVEGIFQSTADGEYISANPAMARMLGYDSAEELTGSVRDIGTQLYAEPEQRKEYLRRLINGDEVSGYQVRLYRKNGSFAWISLHARPVFDTAGKLLMVEGIAQDITQQKQGEEAQRKLEQQLLHAQKMESVGRLAGGIAHDFNNTLGIILGYSDFVLEHVSPEDPNFEYLQRITKAAQRSVLLTRQLLAFARKQTISPKVLDLNAAVSGTLNILTRLIGEDIDLVWLPGKNLSPVKIDPSQIDQVLANLCINARDAISGTGKITIETMDVTLDEAYCSEHPETTPGAYVMLAVQDNGSGMEETILSDIFEPFFTTKEPGKGTGLGLATVYGIVKQNNGGVSVNSNPGHGTTFRIYFPVYAGNITGVSDEASPVVTSKGNETVLLVEDEAMLLDLGEKMLRKLGYNVISANSPSEAIQVVVAYPADIHLIITDVIMPEMNGRDLADQLKARHPAAKCLFMSGYSADVIAYQGVLDAKVHFIEKPFTRQQLAAMVRKVLDEQAELGKDRAN
jgi:PAS domain S-box-containing protein